MAAQEHERAEVARRRRRWFRWILPWLSQRPPRPVFINETAVSTTMARLRGRVVRGRRLKAKAPYAKWGTQTVVAALRAEALTAPRAIPGAMNRVAFDLYIQTLLARPLVRDADQANRDGVRQAQGAPASCRCKSSRHPDRDTLIATFGRVCGLFESHA